MVHETTPALPAQQRARGARLAPRTKDDQPFWLLLALVVTLAAGTRFYRLGADEYWLDELHSMGSSAATRAAFEDFPFGTIFTHRPRGTELGPESTLSNVWYEMRGDIHPPLFFTVLNLWRRAVGDSEVAVRALSAICSVISVAAVALLFRRLGRPSVGLLAACLLALAFGHIHMAQQNRQYSMAVMFTVLSYLALIVAEDRESAARRRNSREKAGTVGPKVCHGSVSIATGVCYPGWRILVAWSLYALTLCLCVLTHYFTALALAGHLVYAGVRFRRAALWHWIGAATCAGALFALLWGGAFLTQWSDIGPQEWLSDSGEGHVYRSLMRGADLPLRLLFQLPSSRIELWRSFGGLLLMCLAALATWRKPSREALLMSAWFILPCIGLLLMDIAFERQTLSHIRYSAVAIPALGGLMAMAIVQLPGVWRYAAGTGLCAAMLGTLSFPTTSNPDARFAVAELASRAAPNDLIVFEAGGDWIPLFFAPMEFYMNELQRGPAGTGEHGIRDFSSEPPASVGAARPPASVGAEGQAQRQSIANHDSGEFHVGEADNDKSGGWPNPMLLLRDPPSPALIERISAFDRFWVVSPRVDESNRPIIPDHCPATHTLKAKSGYIWQIGWIYLFERAN